MKLLVIPLLLVLIGCTEGERPYRHFSSYSPELHSGFWIPQNIFPSDIYDIHELHDIDTNEVWMRFTAGETKIDVSQMTKTSKSSTNPLGRSWWTNELTNEYVVYSSKNEGRQFFLAISETNNLVYWWSP